MLSHKGIKAVLLGTVLLTSTACSANTGCDVEVFRCKSDTPKPITLTLCKLNNTFSLQQFMFDGTALDTGKPLTAVTKDSYHRFKVDEHSLTFVHNGQQIVLSEYFSAEFEPYVKTLSVTLQQGDTKHYVECDESAQSQLKTIKNGSYN